MAAKKLKASERTTLLGKLTTQLKKRYGSKAPEPAEPRSVLETLLFGALLEEAIEDEAEPALASMLAGFHDLNEIRVSSIREIERTIPDLHAADWKSLRIKDALQHIFELNFVYDLDALKKKNQEQQAGELSEIPNATPFMRLYTLQAGLGNHVLPVDRHQLALLNWLGLTDAVAAASGKKKSPPAEELAADELKSAVRKSDGVLLSYLLRRAANEPCVLEVTLDELDAGADDDEVDPKARISELDGLIEGGGKPSGKKKTAKATKTTKKAAKAAGKKATKKTAAKKSSKRAAKKTAK